MEGDLSVEALKPFNDLLKETVEARKLSGGKIERLTAMAMENIKFDSQIITDLYTQHRSLQPASLSKIHSLYCFDSIARACKSKVNKKISANIDGERGTCAGFLLKVEGVLDGLVKDMLNTGGKDWPDGREKTKKILDIWQKGSTFSKEVIHRLQVLLEAATPAPKATAGQAAKKKSPEHPPKGLASSTPSTGRGIDSKPTTTPTSSPPSSTLPSQGYFSSTPASVPSQTSITSLAIPPPDDNTEPSPSLSSIPTPPLAAGVPASLLTLLQKFTSSNPPSTSVPLSDAPISETLEASSNSPTARAESPTTVVHPSGTPNSASIQTQPNAPTESSTSTLSGPPTMPPFPPTMLPSGYPTLNPSPNASAYPLNPFPAYPSPLSGPVNPMLHQAQYNHNQAQSQMFIAQQGGFINSFNGPQFGANQGLNGHQNHTPSNGTNENRWRSGGSDENSRGRGGGGRGGYRGRGGMNSSGYNDGNRGSMQNGRGGFGYRPNMYPSGPIPNNPNTSSSLPPPPPPPPPAASAYPSSNGSAVPVTSSALINQTSDSRPAKDSAPSNSPIPPPSDDTSAVPLVPKKRKSRFDQPPSHPAPPAPVPTSTPIPVSASIPTPMYPLASFNPATTPNVRNQPSALASLSWSTFNPENPRSWEDLSVAFARDNHGLLPSNEVLYALGTTMMMRFGG